MRRGLIDVNFAKDVLACLLALSKMGNLLMGHEERFKNDSMKLSFL